MPSKILSFPLALWVAYILYQSFINQVQGLELWLVPPVILLVTIYVLHNQINDYWYSRHSVSIDKDDKIWLQRFDPVYNRYNPELKHQFEQKLTRWLHTRDFMPMAMDTLPEEFKMMVGAPQIHLSLNMTKDPWKSKVRIALYRHPFISPDIQNVHVSEFNKADGMFIFSVEQLNAAWINWGGYYNPGFHSAIESLDIQHFDWPKFNVEFSQSLEHISGLSEQTIASWMGIPAEQLNLIPIAIHHYFVFHESFIKQLPDWTSAIEKFLNKY